MWQLAWMLSFIPDFFWTFLLWGSLIVFAATYLSIFLKFYPPLVLSAKIIRPVALLIAFLSVYWQGGIDVEKRWKEEVAKMQEKVDQAQAAATQRNIEIQTQVVTKTKVIREKGDTIVQYVDRVVTQDKEVVKFIENCPIPPSIVKTINAAAKNQPIEEKK